MIYYTVFDSGGKKIADCGNESDAKQLADYRKGTYKTNRLQYSQTVDIQLSKLELPSIKIGGQEIPVQQYLPDTELEPFITNYHD